MKNKKKKMSQQQIYIKISFIHHHHITHSFMSSRWPEAFESLNDYCKNSYDLPSDHSLISPVARVILQKRRLLKIEEIHSLLLEASSDPSERLVQLQVCILKKLSSFPQFKFVGCG